MRYLFKKKSLAVLVWLFDLAGYVVTFPFKMLGGNSKNGSVKKILIIRLDHIGDVVMSIGVLSSLRKKYPGAVIDLMAPGTAAELLKNNAFLDNLIRFEAPWFSRRRQGIKKHLTAFLRMTDVVKSGRYDIALDLRGDLRHIAAMFFSGTPRRISYGITGGGFFLTDNVPYNGAMHEEDKNILLLGALGIKKHKPVCTITFDEDDRRQAREIKKWYGIEDMYAVIHAVPGHPSKKWDREKFVSVTEYIRDVKRLLPVFVGTEEDGGFIRAVIAAVKGGVIDLSGKTRLGVTAKLIEEASLFLGVDSGAAHIASVLGVSTFIIFSGINDPAQWAPRGENVHLVYPGRGKDLSFVSAGDVCKVVDKILD